MNHATKRLLLMAMLLIMATTSCSDRAVDYNNLGTAVLQKGRVDEAMMYFQKALQLKPDYAEAHNNLGFALLQKGKVDEAIACFQKALSINPGYATARKNLDQALLQKQKADQAIVH